MEWIIPTVVDLEGVMTSDEREIALAFTTESLPDRLEAVIANLASEVQMMIATFQPNTISSNPLKIPPGMLGQFLVLARSRVLTGIPNYVQDEDRRAETKTASAFFLKVADGTIRPQPSDDAEPNTVPSEKPSGVQQVSGPGSRTGRVRMDGI